MRCSRALINNVKIPPAFLRASQIDLRRVIHRKPTYGTLRQLASSLGLPVETKGGEEMPGLFKEGKWEEIKAHGAEDVRITRAVYERCVEVGLMEPLPIPAEVHRLPNFSGTGGVRTKEVTFSESKINKELYCQHHNQQTRVLDQRSYETFGKALGDAQDYLPVEHHLHQPERS